VPNSDESCSQTRLKIGSRHCAAALFLQVTKSCTDLDQTFLYISILGIHSKFVVENNMRVLGVCLSQLCPSASRRFAASRCSRILFASPEAMHRPRSDSPLHIDIKNMNQMRTQNKMLTLGVCFPRTLLERWPQVCHVKITLELLRTTSFVCKDKFMKCLVKWIPANMHVRSNQSQPCFDSLAKWVVKTRAQSNTWDPRN